MTKNIRTTIRIPEELYQKIELFGKENNLKTFNGSLKKIIELGILYSLSDFNSEEKILKIMNQNNYIIKMLEDKLYGE